MMVQAAFVKQVAGLAGVIARIQVHSDDFWQWAQVIEPVEGGFQQRRVMAVGAGQDPAQRNPVALDQQ